MRVLLLLAIVAIASAQTSGPTNRPPTNPPYTNPPYTNPPYNPTSPPYTNAPTRVMACQVYIRMPIANFLVKKNDFLNLTCYNMYPRTPVLLATSQIAYGGTDGQTQLVMAYGKYSGYTSRTQDLCSSVGTWATGSPYYITYPTTVYVDPNTLTGYFSGAAVTTRGNLGSAMAVLIGTVLMMLI